MIGLWLLHHPTLTHLLDSLLQERLLLWLLLGSWLVRVGRHQGSCLSAPNSPIHSNQLIGSLHGGLLYQIAILILKLIILLGHFCHLNHAYVILDILCIHTHRILGVTFS